MAKIPERKRDKAELQEMRARNAFAVKPPVAQLQAQAVNRLVLGIFYLICLTGAGLVIKSYYPHGIEMEPVFISGMACAAVGLLVSLWIFWKKPRSRHHAAFMAIISLLVLVFGTVYYIEQFEQEAHDDA
jgi:hypothetical protein